MNNTEINNEAAHSLCKFIKEAYKAGQAVTVAGREVFVRWEIQSVASVYSNDTLSVSVKARTKNSKTGSCDLFFKSGAPLPVITVDGAVVAITEIPSARW